MAGLSWFESDGSQLYISDNIPMGKLKGTRWKKMLEKKKFLHNMFWMDEESKEFYKKVFALVLPMALQNLINTGITTADVVMLGKVGEDVLSGSSLAGQIQFILNLIFFGITSGATVLTAQYWGKNDKRTIEKVLGIALRLSLITGILFTVITLCFPEQLMRIFTSEQPVIDEGVKYLKIVAFTYLLMSVTMIYLNIMRSVERVIISTVVYLVSMIINIIGNAIFIFGLFGMPAMGIEGAALSTLIARIMELIMVLVYAKFINGDIRLRISDVWKRNPILFRDFLKYSAPVIINEMIWGAGFSANAAVIGHLNSSAVAANSVAQVARNLATVIVFGVANATSIMLGKTIGENKTELAEKHATRFIKLSVIFGIVGGGVILLARPLVVTFFSVSERSANYMSFMLICMAVYVLAQAINTTLIVGVFRAGGDTKVGLYMDAGSMWGGSILWGAIAAFVFQAPVEVVYMILLADELIKLPLSFWRYRQKKWLNNVTR